MTKAMKSLSPLNLQTSQIRNEEQNLKLYCIEKTTHIQEQPTEQQTHENDGDDDETIDRELERVQQKIQQLQKEKENFASQLQEKIKASEKLEKLNQAKEQV
jgi:hypothetical protein